MNCRQSYRRILFRVNGLPLVFVLLVFVAGLAIPKQGSGYVMVDFLYEFGSYGKGPGMLKDAQALALDLLGDVYVADTENHRIQVFGPSGEFLRQWGGKGSGKGEFDSPSGVTVGNDRVYVADTDNHRVQIFDTQGNYIDSFGNKGGDPKEFRAPKGLVWWNGLLYIADTGNDRIQAFTEDGIFLFGIDQEKSGSRALEKPCSLSVDPFGNIFVIGEKGKMDILSQQGKPRGPGAVGGNAISLGPDGTYIANRSRIFRFTHDESLKQFFVSGGNNELRVSDQDENASGMLSEISALAINTLKNLYVLSSKEGTIRVFRTRSGEAGPVPLEMPSSVAFSKDISMPSQLVLSHFNEAVFAFDREGLKISSFNDAVGAPAESGNKKAAGKQDSGNIWVADAERHRLHAFSSDGKLLTTIGEKGGKEGQFSFPSDIALHNNYLYVADSGNARIQMLDLNGKYVNSFGTPGSGKGNLGEPVALAFDNSNNLYVADKELNKIVKLDSSGNFVLEFGKEGEGDGQFRDPLGIVVINAEIYVLDSGNNRVQVFDPGGVFLRKFASEGNGKGEFKRPSSMYADDRFNLYVFDVRNSRVQTLRLLLTPSRPRALTADGMIKEIKITWLPNPEFHVAAYKILRREKGESDYEEIGKVEAAGSFPKLAYFDKNLKSGTTFHYAVVAVSKTGHQSVMSKPLEAATKRLVPSAPALLKTQAGQKDIYVEWKPSPEPYTDHYLILKNNEVWQSSVEVGKTRGNSFRDTNLEPDTRYKYRVVAVGAENDMSEPAVFEVTTMKLPTLEIKLDDPEDIFANNYKYYENHPLGKVSIKNNSKNIVTGVKISVMVRDYMDYPTEAVIERVQGGEALEVPVMAVFNNKLLSLTENSSVPAEIEVSYFEDKEKKTISLSKPFKIFEKHSLIWDKSERAAVFITPKDPLLLELAASAVSGYALDLINRPLLQARAVFEALGLLGIKYMQDPNNPYQVVSQDLAQVDYIQYPRETLKRKAGDCDDLVVLYASMLESLGISTAFVSYPGHIFLMFDTAVSLEANKDFGFPSEDFVTSGNTIWVPVEVTLVGKGFSVAWGKAMEQYREWADKGLHSTIVKDAWQDFKPATLEYEEISMEKVDAARIETAFPGEIESFKRRRINYLASLVAPGNSETPRFLEQLGILYGENGMHSEAMETFGRYLSLYGEDAMVLNNVGNLHFLQGNYKNAEKAYLKALSYEPQDTGILMNCARTYLKQKAGKKAVKFFESAVKIDPEAARKYFYLSSELRR